ncbi:glutathione-disulfide reductase [Parvularcula dongshanensis]|uniref:Glutathione reductase n=1 Tax=Parvularcula dongshanensis TaxID=1173995 RepID=A0A840I3Z0_9PROT|nr:glutathione-disulfide reductase [Parvularcula dongshanensis]MBB4659042.1 glutathione reductase (NADPH) [Parvularcula dongshanensis]
MAYDYDLFVLGAGSGGVRAARMSAQLGARVAVAEASRVGGTCVIRGCVPKKLFVYASEYAHAFEDAKGYGWTAQNVSFDWNVLRDNKDAEIDRLNAIYKRILASNGVTLIEERAVLKDPHTVTLAGGREVTAERILIAVGGEPIRDETIPGHEHGIVSDDAFDLPELPKRAVIAGGGYIAVEFAFIMAGLGVETTLVYRGERLLRAFDKEVSAAVETALREKGITYLNERVFTKIEAVGDARRVHLTKGEPIETDLVFWAVGRRPKTAGLGLEAVGVETGRYGEILVDEHSRTNVASVWAIGDVTNRINLTPVAIREGAAFARTEFGGVPTRMDYRFVPKAVFSQPPVGSVGYTEDEARTHCAEAGHAVDVYETDFRPMRNTLSGNPERMLMKLVVERETDLVMGCHIVGHEAPEMIQALAIPIKHGVTKREFDETCALHPTSAEELVTLTKRKES